MKSVRKSKKGFTLVEMVLSVAIICMIGGVIAGVCASISSSFATTYDIDDAADYSMLYSKGFENSFLACTQTDGSDNLVWYISNPKADSSKYPTLMFGPQSGTCKPVFEPKFIGNTKTDYKWRIALFFYYDEANEYVHYRMFLADAYNKKTDYIYMFDDSFWVPRLKERADFNSKSMAITVDGSDMNAKTLKKYGFTDGQIAKLPSKAFDSKYKTQIKFNP